ncbi:MAG TPA: ABC transporter substrate-binding protein [Hyphomicrobiaceae bacterium]|nr:ABC transporter substrate-binding protein [Hyphomicrobiaceae bacterium]
MQLVRLLAFLAASLLSLTPVAAQDVIKIGANLPMSGPNAEYGELFGGAASLAVEHANADKMLSKKLVIQFEDSQALPQQGVVAMNKLVSVEKVPFVLSAFTGVSKAIAPVGDKAKVVSVNGGGIGPDLAELGDYFWNVIPLVNLEIRVLAPYVVKERNLKRVAIVYVDDPAGEAVRKELADNVPKAGGQMVGELQIPRNAQQFTSIAAKVREAKPDLVVIASFGAQQAQIVKQLRDNGVTQQLAGYSAFSSPTVTQLPEAKGALFPTQSVDWSAPGLSQRVAKDWKAKTGKEPNAYVANYYNAVMVFVKLAQELEKRGEPITGENLLKARKVIGTFDLVGGKMEFLPNGSVSMPIQINEIDGGVGKMVKAGVMAK